MSYGIIGVGSIAQAIVTGLSRCEREAPRILLSPRNERRAAQLAALYPNVHIASSNQAVVDDSSVLILSLRPNLARAVLGELNWSEGQAAISVMAGVQLEMLRGLLAPARDIARAIPLPSVALGRGFTAVHPLTTAAKVLFDRLGVTIEAPNVLAFEAFSASTATIATHFAYLDAVSRWLAAKGIREEDARSYVAAMFSEVADSLATDEIDFRRLSKEYATPGGLNEQFLALLEDANVFDVVDQGLRAVHDRLMQRQP